MNKEDELREIFKNFYQTRDERDKTLEILAEYAGSLPPLLFHYCDMNGIKGILESKLIWATHYKFLNDSTEVQYGRELVLARVKQFFLKETNADVKGLLEKVLLQSSPTILGDDFVHQPILNEEVYIASFSEIGDQLSQWRGYGLDGMGFSLGVDPSQIKTITHKQIVLKDLKTSRFIKIQYDYEVQVEIIDKILEVILAKVRIIYENKKLLLKSEHHLISFEIKAIGSIFYHLGEVILHFKDSSFREEKEWRVIVLQLGSSAHNTVEDIFLRVANQNLIPYLKVDFSSKSNKDLIPVKKILIGPKNTKAPNSVSLRVLLFQLGYKDYMPAIIPSKIPYL